MSPHFQRPSNLDELQDVLGLHFSWPALLIQALTHPSYVNEQPGSDEDDNQRLEFLGDAILSFIVGDWLYNHYPASREGELTSLRASIVRTESLAEVAGWLGLGEMMRFGRGEKANGGSERPANLCAAFEALIGAVYLDSGIEHVRKWLWMLLDSHADQIEAHRLARDSKSTLQELVQFKLKVTPVYSILRTSGPDHAKRFTAVVSINGAVWGQGSGYSKQAAEQAAAAAALIYQEEQGIFQ